MYCDLLTKQLIFCVRAIQYVCTSSYWFSKKNASKLGAHNPIYCFIKLLRHPKRIRFSNRILTFFPIPLVQGTELPQPVAQMANPFFFPLTWHKPLEAKGRKPKVILNKSCGELALLVGCKTCSDWHSHNIKKTKVYGSKLYIYNIMACLSSEF